MKILKALLYMILPAVTVVVAEYVLTYYADLNQDTQLIYNYGFQAFCGLVIALSVHQGLKEKSILLMILDIALIIGVAAIITHNIKVPYLDKHIRLLTLWCGGWFYHLVASLFIKPDEA